MEKTINNTTFNYTSFGDEGMLLEIQLEDHCTACNRNTYFSKEEALNLKIFLNGLDLE